VYIIGMLKSTIYSFLYGIVLLLISLSDVL